MAALPSWWTDAVSPLVFVVLGAAVSLYATVVLERYNRFVTILREINHTRRRAELFPLSVADLERARDAGIDYWHRLEHARDDMDAEGQHRAARRIGRLVSFAYIATSRIERLFDDSRDADRSDSVAARLKMFQAEFNRIKESEFLKFEDSIKGELSVFLKPLPQRPITGRAAVEVVDYFSRLP